MSKGAVIRLPYEAHADERAGSFTRRDARRTVTSALAFGLCALLSACAIIPKASPPASSASVPSTSAAAASTAAASAALLGAAQGPSIAGLAMREVDAGGALTAFRRTCPKILRRQDVSGLTQPRDWQQPCDAAASWRGSASAFFESEFEAVRIGDGGAFATGYFEPEIAASRVRSERFNSPIYAVPSDLVRAWPDDVPEAERTGRPPRGKIGADGRYSLYDERAEIVAGSLEGRADVIAYAADPVEFFVLQIQGSGLLRLPDGSLTRIGYASQNGRAYTGIGRVMREAGQIGTGTPYATSMQGITQFIRDNPREGQRIMNLNKSWVFFRELTTDGPLGSLEVPVYARDSVAVDPRFVPYGAPVWLDLDRNEADGLWIAQDTGGAIKGANRFDTFWGAGAEARRIAGGMSSRGQALILLPKGTLARLRTGSGER